MLTILLAALTGCATLRPPPPANPVATTVEAPPAEAPVSFAPLEERVNAMLGEVQDADQRDRLIEMRDFMLAMRGQDPAAQKRVFVYVEKVLRVEERSRPAPLNMDGGFVPIEEEPVGTPPATPGTPPPSTPPSSQGAPVPSPEAAVAEARTAMADARYLDVVTRLDGVDSADARSLRKEAIDAWARAERERAGHMFLEARQLPPGGERVASLRAARQALVAINDKFPDNAYAAQIKENIAKVDADLAAAGAKP